MPIRYPQEGQVGGPQQYYQITTPVGASPDLTQVVDELNFHLTNISQRFGQTTPDGNIEYNIVGGWNVSQDTIHVTNVTLDSVNEKITVGSIVLDGLVNRLSILDPAVVIDGGDKYISINSTTYGAAGIQLQYNAGTPQAYIGDGSNKYFKYTSAGGVECKNFTVNDIQQGSEVSIQGWQHDLVFSATDADTVAWASGTITLMDGTTYSIDAGSTSDMSAITYIYLDIAVSSGTVLQKTTTAATAVGSGKILVAVAEDKTDEAFFQVFGGIGGVLLSADMIAANAITANEIAANTITAAEIAAGTITADEINVGSFISLPSDANLVGYWALDDSAGTLAIDGSGNGNDGTLTNMEADEWVAGVVGTGLDFAGDDEHIDCGTGLGTTLGNGITDISVSFWFKADVTNSTDGLFYLGDFSSHGELYVAIFPSIIKFRMHNNDFDYSIAFTDTASWHHCVVTYDGTNGKLYLDSVEEISESYSTGIDLSGLKTVIGAYYDATHPLDGKMDEVRVYDRALTASEVKALYLYPAGNKATTISGGQIATNTITASHIKGTAFGTLTITSGKIAINTTDALEIQASGNVLIKQGGDLIMEGAASGDPSLIKFKDEVVPGEMRFERSDDATKYIHMKKGKTDNWLKIANPSTLPAGDGYGAAFDHDGSKLAIAHSGTPFVTVYNTSDWSYIAAPTDKPASTSYGVAFNYDSSLLVVAHDLSPYITIYDTSDWSKLSDPTDLPNGLSLSAAFNHDGSLLAVANQNSPFVTIYDTSDWSKLANPVDLPEGQGTGVAFNDDSTLLAISHDNAPFITIYNTSDWSRLSDPVDEPTGRGEDVAFNYDGSLMAVAHDSSPYVTIYNTSNWSKITNPSSLPLANAEGIAFNHDGSLMAVSCTSGPLVIIYNTSDWSTVTDSVQQPTSIAEDVTFNNDGTLFVVAHRSTPFVSIYTGDVFYVKPSAALSNTSGLFFGSIEEGFAEILLNAPAIMVPNMATSNPGAGVLWNDSGTIKMGT